MSWVTGIFNYNAVKGEILGIFFKFRYAVVSRYKAVHPNTMLETIILLRMYKRDKTLNSQQSPINIWPFWASYKVPIVDTLEKSVRVMKVTLITNITTFDNI